MPASRYLTTEALILSTKISGEQNKIVVFLSPQIGVAQGIAYGGARLKSKFISSVQNFNKVQLYLYRTPKSHIYKLEDISRVISNEAICKDLRGFYLLSFFSEVISRSYLSSEEYKKYYYLLDYSIQLLRSPGSGSDSMYHKSFLFFTVKYFFLSGYVFSTEFCKVCNQQFQTYFFDPVRGGVVCEKHASSRRYGLSDKEAKILGWYFKKKFPEIQELDNEDCTFSSLFVLLSDFMKTLFDNRIKSLSMLSTLFNDPKFGGLTG